jgi:hypothetical protein
MGPDALLLLVVLPRPTRPGPHAGVHGPYFAFVEAAKLDSLDELLGLLHQVDS